MVSDPVSQWVLTFAFIATSLHSLVQLIKARTPLLLVGNVLHLVMSIVMVAMCWPWWTQLPSTPQTAIFTAGAVWFTTIAMLQVSNRIPPASVGGHSAWHQAAHTAMMLAMVWMVVVMAGEPETESETHAHHHGSLGVPESLSGVVLTAALLTSGIVFLVDFLRSIRGRPSWLGHTGDLASGMVMSLGMAAMGWPMIVG